ncbi:hypothetical protein [Halorussus halobius]|uniref:hypothetical protein n=1 Tax=Halorussus halobius TaxID=1710537 RepID=UPI00109261F4|nr:hypothetical protein [Halorussus halobius]
MVFRGAEPRPALEALTGKLFLVGGGAAIASAVGSSVGAFALVPLPDALAALPLLWMVESLPVLASLPLAVAAVVVLYPRLVDRTPAVATSGLLLAVVPWSLFAAVLAWGSASVVVPGVAFSPDAVLSARAAGLALWLAFFLGVGLAGVSLLQTGRHYLAGGGLLAFVVAWNGPLLLAEATGYPPGRVLRFSPTGTALAMVVIGYSLSPGQDLSDGG